MPPNKPGPESHFARLTQSEQTQSSEDEWRPQCSGHMGWEMCPTGLVGEDNQALAVSL